MENIPDPIPVRELPPGVPTPLYPRQPGRLFATGMALALAAGIGLGILVRPDRATDPQPSPTPSAEEAAGRIPVPVAAIVCLPDRIYARGATDENPTETCRRKEVTDSCPGGAIQLKYPIPGSPWIDELLTVGLCIDERYQIQ